MTMSGRHRGDQGPRTEPLGLLVASDHGRHGDATPDTWDRRPRRWPTLVGLAAGIALAGTAAGVMSGRGPEAEPSSSVTVPATVTVTPEPVPGPTTVRWRTATPSPPPPRVLTRTRTITAPAPTVTRWKTRTVTPPTPPQGETDDGTDTAVPGEAAGRLH